MIKKRLLQAIQVLQKEIDFADRKLMPYVNTPLIHLRVLVGNVRNILQEKGQFLTDQELEQIKEQVARQAFEVAYQYFYGMEFSSTDNMLEYCWNDWQQKNKGTPNKLGEEG